jgi:hypothetical protein
MTIQFNLNDFIGQNDGSNLSPVLNARSNINIHKDLPEILSFGTCVAGMLTDSNESDLMAFC